MTSAHIPSLKRFPSSKKSFPELILTFMRRIKSKVELYYQYSQIQIQAGQLTVYTDCFCSICQVNRDAGTETAGPGGRTDRRPEPGLRLREFPVATSDAPKRNMLNTHARTHAVCLRPSSRSCECIARARTDFLMW